MPTSLINKSQLAQLTAAKPEERIKAIQQFRPQVLRRVRDQVGPVLDMAPTVHFLPFQPQPGQEGRVEEMLNNAVKWLESRPDVHQVAVYRLVNAKQRGNTPTYLMVLTATNGKVLEQLLRDQQGKQMAAAIHSASLGKSGTPEGEFSINSMLVGII